MKLITRESKAKSVADRHEKLYPNIRVRFVKQLRALGDSPNPDDINKIMGNDSWTRTYCNECDTENVDIIELGDEPDYESNTANICAVCLKKALDMMICSN